MASAFSVSSLLNEQQQQQQQHDRSSRRPRPAVLDISNLLNNDMATPTLSPTRTPSPVSVSSGPATSSGYPFPPLPSIADTLPGMLPPLSSAYPSMPKPYEPDYQHHHHHHHAHHNSNSGGIGLWMHDSRASSVSSLASNASNCSSTTNETSKSLSQQQQEQHHNHSSSSDEEEQVSSSKQQPVKAKRRRANAKQLEVLNRVFERTVFPSTQLRAELGRQLGMSPRTVQIWFQNRRQAIRTRERQRLLRIVRDDQQVSSPSSTSSSD
ncbi:hypothetical protein O0I10_009171 [Lichtheimia ornata]|uniref:Homeobox domain-containing protein n=1 Tax=Lichtheimia ornata TaxID=688661 RepID=A0AAD7UZU0_9FUNG|nr:uncharacterized protein O0I10_009171 [Lichtheimia ornata]KAJ8655136.1 hypothetical protein O0I10_009171 [Lichtheimia ornata]